MFILPRRSGYENGKLEFTVPCSSCMLFRAQAHSTFRLAVIRGIDPDRQKTPQVKWYTRIIVLYGTVLNLADELNMAGLSALNIKASTIC